MNYNIVSKENIILKPWKSETMSPTSILLWNTYLLKQTKWEFYWKHGRCQTHLVEFFFVISANIQKFHCSTFKNWDEISSGVFPRNW